MYILFVLNRVYPIILQAFHIMLYFIREIANHYLETKLLWTYANESVRNNLN